MTTTDPMKRILKAIEDERNTTDFGALMDEIESIARTAIETMHTDKMKTTGHHMTKEEKEIVKKALTILTEYGWATHAPVVLLKIVDANWPTTNTEKGGTT